MSGRIQLRVAAPDDALGVEFHVAGERIDTDLVPPYETELDTGAYPDGPLNLAAVTRDRDERVGMAAISVHVENSGPLVEVRAPADAATLFAEDGPVALALTVSDASGVAGVEVEVTGAEVWSRSFDAPQQLELYGHT